MKRRLAFLATKEVPTLAWSSPFPLNIRPKPKTFFFLVLGLSLFGLGEAILIAANLGVSPWTVLAQGMGLQTGWTIGLSTFVISFMVLVLWLPLKQRPGIGTILNAVIISLILEYVLPYLPVWDSRPLQVAQAIFGIALVGVGAAIYLIANLGPGPRDGLMTGLQRVTNLPIGWVRSGIEITVVILGWFLGGSVGLGTILFALLIGPAVSASLFAFGTWVRDKT